MMPDITLDWRKADSFPGNFSSPTTIQERPCPICGSIRYRTFLRFDQFQFYSDSAELPKRADVRHVQCFRLFYSVPKPFLLGLRLSDAFWLPSEFRRNLIQREPGS